MWHDACQTDGCNYTAAAGCCGSWQVLRDTGQVLCAAKVHICTERVDSIFHVGMSVRLTGVNICCLQGVARACGCGTARFHQPAMRRPGASAAVTAESLGRDVLPVGRRALHHPHDNVCGEEGAARGVAAVCGALTEVSQNDALRLRCMLLARL